ncbi:MAG TPA: MFS transporter [Frankiaceae bacterium]
MTGVPVVPPSEPLLGPPAAPAPAGWPAARRLLRGPLRLLVAGQCLGQLADGLAQIAFAQYVVFDAGRGATPARIAGLLAVTLLPFSVVGPFAGVLIDRWPRRRILAVMSLVRAVLVVGAVGTVLTRSEPGAYAGVLLLLSTSRFVLAAKGAALPRTVDAADLVPATSISAVAGMSASFLGAVGGAVFVGRSAAGGLVVAALLYLGAAAVFARLPDVGGGTGPVPLGRVGRVALDVGAGVRTIVTRADIGRPLVAVWLHRLLSGAGFVLLVLISDSRFHLTIGGYGLAIGATGIAAFLGSLAAPPAARRWPAATLLPVAFLPPVAAAFGSGVAPALPVLVGGVAVTAFSFQLMKVRVDALVGGASPDAVRGRVFSVYDVLYNVAFVLAGLLMVPLWRPGWARPLLWGLAAVFLLGWLACARLVRGWPLAGRAATRSGRRRRPAPPPPAPPGR